MSKFVALLTAAYVNGVFRQPHEGVLHLDDAEADRLISNEAAKDVTADFSTDDRKDVPVEGLRANKLEPGTEALPAVEHQANIAPDPAPASPPPTEKKPKA